MYRMLENSLMVLALVMGSLSAAQADYSILASTQDNLSTIAVKLSTTQAALGITQVQQAATTATLGSAVSQETANAVSIGSTSVVLKTTSAGLGASLTTLQGLNTSIGTTSASLSQAASTITFNNQLMATYLGNFSLLLSASSTTLQGLNTSLGTTSGLLSQAASTITFNNQLMATYLGNFSLLLSSMTAISRDNYADGFGNGENYQQGVEAQAVGGFGMNCSSATAFFLTQTSSATFDANTCVDVVNTIQRALYNLSVSTPTFIP